MRRLRSITLYTLLAALLSASVMAQTGSTTVRGTVTDTKGAILPGATVRLVSEEKGFSRTVVTNDTGSYTFTSVPPDTYRVEIEAKGFKKHLISNVIALVDKPTDANAALEVGSVNEVVNVSGGDLSSIVNTQDASLGNNFVSQQILQLPLQGRNVANLLSLQPGVTPNGYVTGSRADQANITLDGIDVNDQQTGLNIDQTAAFAPVLRVNPDSVDEFRVTTSNPDATKGRSSGAQVSLITKSGSNQFHGALYEYHRNTATTANDWFNNAAGSFVASDAPVIAGLAKVGDPRVPRPQLLRNLFGGRLGGPIVKDRLFFFYNYEGMREAKALSVSRVVPTASLAAGNVQFDDTGCPSPVCSPAIPPRSWTITAAQINSMTLTGGTAAGPVVDVNPAITSLFAAVAGRYPVNDTTLGDGRNTGGFRFNAPVPVKQNGHTARIDWAVTKDQKHQISIRGNYQQDLTGVASFFPDTPGTNTWSHPLGLSVSHTWLLNNNMTNRFSYGLTRLAFSNQGDSNDPAITFRFIFQPTAFGRAFNRTNPTHNFTDDFTWIKGNHSLQMGTNIRLITNTRVNFAKAFDNATTNPSAYASNVTKTVVDQFIRVAAGDPAGSTRAVASSWSTNEQGALTALLGRLNSYGANINFDTSGKLIPANTGIKREFKTQEYDVYFQDAWKMRSNLTLTAGLRYGISVPVYETQGYETVPSIELSQYLADTVAAMNNGINLRTPISVRKAGKVNGLDSIYPMDKNNFQPRVSVAWSPNFEHGFLSKLFGKGTESVFRGGFAITNDYFGQQLATNWDAANTLGFSSTSAINVNTFNITTNPGPLYTGPSVNIRSLPVLTIPTSLAFPLTAPQVTPGNGKIETSLDQNLISPINYSWNVSYGRRLPGNIWIDAAYIGRLARHLLAGRDAMMIRDIRDPRSGLSYNQAGTMLEKQLQANVPATQITSIPFYDNMWAPGTLGPIFGCPPGTGTCTNTQAVYGLKPDAGDWTFTMQLLDGFTGSRYFFQGQYDSLSAFGTIGSSDYHGATVSIRQRFPGITWDFNYTYSKSLDDASGLQTGNLFGAAFILNAFNLRGSRSVSDFDFKHVVNFNGIWDIPIGKGRHFGKDWHGLANALLGGWQLSGIYRFNSGQPFAGYFDGTGWQTNWQVRSFESAVKRVSTGTFFNTKSNACTTGCTLPNLFADPDAAYASFRTPYPGETGTRNPIRYPSSFNIDAGLGKSFNVPKREGERITIRWDVFNVTNTPIFTGQSSALAGYTGSAADGSFGRFTQTRNNARVMQFAFRYEF